MRKAKSMHIEWNPIQALGGHFPQLPPTPKPFGLDLTKIEIPGGGKSNGPKELPFSPGESNGYTQLVRPSTLGMWVCRCFACEKEFRVAASSVRLGIIKSCGCQRSIYIRREG